MSSAETRFNEERKEKKERDDELTDVGLSCRENHDEDKPALNSISDNTVAMEVT